jgi:hypothetical protein
MVDSRSMEDYSVSLLLYDLDDTLGFNEYVRTNFNISTAVDSTRVT